MLDKQGVKDSDGIKKTKIFNGERLKSARVYRGKTISEVAEKINVTKQSVSLYEKGKMIPQYEILMCISAALDFPLDYFLESKEEEIILGNTYFRASTKMSKKEEKMQKEKAKILTGLYTFLNEYIEFPELNLPEVEDEMCIEEVANKLRVYWGLGDKPIKDIVYHMEKNGIIVTEMLTNSDNVDAFSQPVLINDEKACLVILGNDKKSATRRQFSAAHELGHLILHENYLELEGLELNELTREEHRKIENEAHEFATALMLPKDAFKSDIEVYKTDLDYYKQLKKKWRMSISAMLVRANRIEALSYNSYQGILKKMSKLGWRKKEPLDDTLEMMRPTLLRRSIEILIDNDVLSETEILIELSKRNLSLLREEVEMLLGLDKGRLKGTEEVNNVIAMPVRKS